jgi:hypothetical protein
MPSGSPGGDGALAEFGHYRGEKMLKWVSRLLGGAGTAVSEDVSQQWVARFEGQLERLAAKEPALTSRLVDYICTGEPAAALAAPALGVSSPFEATLRFGHERHAEKFYAGADAVPADVLVRWGRVLQACGPQAGQARYQLAFANGAHWPELLLLHAGDRGMWTYGGEFKVARGLSLPVMERALVEDGLPEQALLISAMTLAKPNRWSAATALAVSGMAGYAQHLATHVDSVAPLLAVPGVDERLHVLQMLQPADVATIARLAVPLADLATCSSKQVRAAAEPLLRRASEAAVEPLKTLSKEAKPEQRVCALRVLWEIARTDGDDTLRAHVRDTASADAAPSAQALITEWDSTPATGLRPEQAYRYEMPEVEWAVPLTSELSRALQGMWDELNVAVDKANREGQERERRSRANPNHYQYRHTALRNYTADELDAVRAHLAGAWAKKPASPLVAERPSHYLYSDRLQILQRFAVQPGVSPVALLKLLDVLREGSPQGHVFMCAFNAMHRACGRPSLLELGVMLQALDIPPERLLRSYCYSAAALARDWDGAAQWPFFAHHADLLVRYVNPTTTAHDYGFDRAALFGAIATLPTPPDALVSALFDLALGAGKTDRLSAQDALHNLPGKEARIVLALADGKSEVRTLAAQWLARLGQREALPALERALAKEKHDVAKGALLDALEAFGQPVEKYLDRGALPKDAAKALAKGVPADLAWFPFDALPRVRWADDGSEVDPQVLRWFMVQAVKQKSPEPNAVLRKYCRMFEARDAEAFGQFILDAWLREDVRPIGEDEALRLAVSHAQSMHGWAQSSPQYYSAYVGKSVEELCAMFLPGYRKQPAGSATPSKGLLALAAACARERAAPAAARFLKEYYGTRASQGKSLIAMLAWVDHPSATQLMLSVGNRFRTKSFQEEAMRQAQALAERRGWSVAELADRTIPSAGFDEDGVLELSFGARSFSARLLPDFKVELANPEGKKIASLPEPRQDDDAELAKNAKKAFSSAKKEVKDIVALQTDRLYEALCTERDWRFEDWQLYLNRHAIVRRLLQRLVWVEMAGGRVVRSFRPLDDGTLSDHDDNEVHLDADARVRVAHDSILEAADVQRWLQHLADYEVQPLFQQLGKGTYRLADDKKGAQALADFEGHMLEAFSLRNRALKLGYTRGSAQDGGWFMTYEKRFPTLGLQAVIEFTGNPLPEENRNVALVQLSFETLQGGGAANGDSRKPSIGDVPRVLLSECYNDMRLIAAEGSGFDAQWRAKSEY